MKTPKLARVADAIVSAINAEITWGVDFRAERSYADFDDQLHELNSVRVDVVPQFAPTLEMDTRATNGWEMFVDVGVRKRFQVDEIDATSGRLRVDAIDELVGLVERFAEFFTAERFTALNDIGAVWIENQIPAAYVRDHLREWSQFTAFVRIKFSLHTTF